jgi:catechol 2,3-dioxygenase
MGHVHLSVTDVEETVRYYRDTLGFGLMAQLGEQAAFLSAGGYHHHLGGNIWQSAGRPYAPEGHARLTQMTIVLPDETSRDALADRLGGVEVTDPSGIPVRLAV